MKSTNAKKPATSATRAVAPKKAVAQRAKKTLTAAPKSPAKKPAKKPTKKQSPVKTATHRAPGHGAATQSLAELVESALARLKKQSTKATLDGMARYAIPSDRAYGVAMKDIKSLGQTLGHNHELAAALWDTGVYEARMLASFVGEPARLTPAQMDQWCRQFDNWAICDTMCFNLFDRTPHVWAKVEAWNRRQGEFEKRTAFALLWSLSVHDKRSGDEPFLQGLAVMQREASDERNFVKKAVNMALRAVGKRNRALHTAAVATARLLAASSDATARWIGKDALRELTSPAVTKRLAK